MIWRLGAMGGLNVRFSGIKNIKIEIYGHRRIYTHVPSMINDRLFVIVEKKAK